MAMDQAQRLTVVALNRNHPDWSVNMLHAAFAAAAETRPELKVKPLPTIGAIRLYLLGRGVKLPDERRIVPAEKYKYQVEKGIRCPPKAALGGKTKKEGQSNFIFPFSYMEVNDSFFVPLSDYGPTGWININSAINMRQQRCDVRYSYRNRNLAEHDEEGWRVWRTK
jgi:hypothetical protein